MAAFNRLRSLLLHTREGLPLQVMHEHERAFERWTATLHLQPNDKQRAAGFPFGTEVARAWSEQPPTFIAGSVIDTPDDTAVFFGLAMFSVPHGQAQVLRSFIAQQTATTAEAC